MEKEANALLRRHGIVPDESSKPPRPETTTQMKIQNAHSFTNEEQNLILKALLSLARSYEDGNGSTAHLPYPERKEHDEIMKLYKSF